MALDDACTVDGGETKLPAVDGTSRAELSTPPLINPRRLCGGTELPRLSLGPEFLCLITRPRPPCPVTNSIALGSCKNQPLGNEANFAAAGALT